jgi:hypothetical protein
MTALCPVRPHPPSWPARPALARGGAPRYQRAMDIPRLRLAAPALMAFAR